MSLKKTKEDEALESPKDSKRQWSFLLNSLKKMVDKKSAASIFSGDDIYHALKLENLVSTGSIQLDINMNGGYAPGRIYEIFGLEASGKSTLVLKALKNFLDKDPRGVAFIDAEHSLNPEYLNNYSIDLDRLILIKPDNGEEAMAMAEAIAASGIVSVIALDSIAGLVPKAEQEKGLQADTMGRLGALMSKSLRNIATKLEASKTAFLMVNQIRSSLSPYGPSEVVPGGHAPKFWSTGRLKVKKTGYIIRDEEVAGQTIEITTEKNKLGAAKKSCTIDFIYAEGFDIHSEIANLALRTPNSGFTISGSWIKGDGGATLCQGLENFVSILKFDQALFDSLKKRIFEIYETRPSLRTELGFEPFNVEGIRQKYEQRNNSDSSTSQPTEEVDTKISS